MRNLHCHNVTINNFNIVGREDLNLMRTIKEALYIRVNDPSLNRNVGKYHLPHVWDEVLFNTSELKIEIIDLMVFPSTTGINICHNTTTLQWLIHLPFGNNICQNNASVSGLISTTETHGNNISH